MSTLWEIDAPHFNVGIVAVRGIVKHVPPIVSYMKGWSMSEVGKLCRRKEWTLQVVTLSKKKRGA